MMVEVGICRHLRGYETAAHPKQIQGVVCRSWIAFFRSGFAIFTGSLRIIMAICGAGN